MNFYQHFYFFRTTAVHPSDTSNERVPCNAGSKAVTELILSTKDRTFKTSEWDNLKAIERTILSVGKEAEMMLLTTESSFYGKKYIAIAYRETAYHF